MLLTVDFDNPVPVYAQIVSQVRDAIAAGLLRPGDFLPSLRDAARSLRINPHTVAKAYRELESEGMVRTDHGRGTQVTAEVARLSAGHRRERLARLAEHMVIQGYLLGATPEQIGSAVDQQLARVLPRFRERSAR